MESEAAEREMAWAEATAKEKAEIASISVKAIEKVEAKAKARVMDKYYAEKIAAAEAANEIRAISEAKR